ncbi:M23 family metallopeptidase [Rudaeicoccus suwonensis]|uniref:Murein DD-endopeptidase MepM/ murein hydrolase activator NlpD n=1 Tax=Rudaeicoccus suwonensis TaxID=657409 RepID=A0A561E8M1_9MICO|nr:M23 family metallopeptidase [Rudaeicoccus suwonensis]TWE11953.1 murein DD-endopeptidase MepM/ murein hydrolase activator NlpD [Rudaeicoccus suwonensis]
MDRYCGRHRPAVTGQRRVWRIGLPATAVAATIASGAAAVCVYTNHSAGEHHSTQLLAMSNTPVAAGGLYGSSTAAAAATARAAALTVKLRAPQPVDSASAATAADRARRAAASPPTTAMPPTQPAPRASAQSAARASGTPKAQSSSAAERNSNISTGWQCAVSDCAGVMTSPFGLRTSPGGVGSSNHLGQDYAVPVGTPLHAMHTGRVVAAGWYGGFGMRVQVDYGGGIETIYGHMSRIDVRVGQRVNGGQVVGLSGNTGHSTGAHLHLEVHVNGRPVNPAPWLRSHGLR